MHTSARARTPGESASPAPLLPLQSRLPPGANSRGTPEFCVRTRPARQWGECRPPADPSPSCLSDDPDADELSIDLLTDSFVVEGVAQIMADARRHGVGSPLLRPNSGGVFD
jgi:hypothetical protein